MNVQLPPPKNWQDFEDLCHRLWMSIWGDPTAHKHGRQGQSQHGVDVYGMPFFGNGEYYGVQCKGKTINYGSELTEDELKSEANDAEAFRPKLKQFIMATTSAADVKIQEVCRALNNGKTHSFNIDVWSWDDISSEIQFREDVYNYFYKDFLFDLRSQNEIHLGSLDNLSKIMVFVTRPCIRKDFSDPVLRYVSMLMYEVVDNSFRHGNASQVSIAYKENGEFCIECDGVMFDVHSLANEGNGGHWTYCELCRVFGDGFKTAYSYDELKNKISFTFDESIRHNEIDPIEIEYPSNRDFNQVQAIAHAEAIYATYSKLGTKIKILIRSEFVMSGSLRFLEVLFNKMEGQIESVSLPNKQIISGLIELCELSGVNYSIR